MAEIEVNGRRYRLPSQPTVVICFDGCDPAYLDPPGSMSSVRNHP